MAHNVVSQITAENFIKVDVNFKIEESTIDTMIGRAAHIHFLEHQAVIKLLIYRYWDLFN
jgi:hypothetical protein